MGSKSSSNVFETMIVGILLVPILAVFQGFVMHKIWLWFIAEPFEVRVIGIAHMIGLSVCIGLIAQYFKDDDKDEDEDSDVLASKFMSKLAHSLSYSVCALVVAWIAKSCM